MEALGEHLIIELILPPDLTSSGLIVQPHLFLLLSICLLDLFHVVSLTYPACGKAREVAPANHGPQSGLLGTAVPRKLRASKVGCSYHIVCNTGLLAPGTFFSNPIKVLCE